MSMAQALADIALGFSTVLGGPYHDAVAKWTGTPVTDDGGSIVTPGEPVAKSCSVQVDSATEAMRLQDGFREKDIPIPRHLLTLLKLAYKRRSGDLGFVVHDKGRQIKDIGGAWDGDMAPDAYVQGSFGRACKRADLVDVSPHTLRHTCGTWLAQAGVDLHKIGGWLGHSDARTTQLYAHHHPDYQDEAKAALDRRRG